MVSDNPWCTAALRFECSPGFDATAAKEVRKEEEVQGGAGSGAFGEGGRGKGALRKVSTALV